MVNNWTIRIPYWIFDGGYFKGRTNASALQVYCCLLRFVDWKTGNGRLGRQKIAEITGLSRETISKAFTFLRSQGVIKSWWRNGDRGFVRYYQVALTPEDLRRNCIAYFEYKAKKTSFGYRSKKSPHKGDGILRQMTSVIRTNVGDSTQPTTAHPTTRIKVPILNVLRQLNK